MKAELAKDRESTRSIETSLLVEIAKLRGDQQTTEQRLIARFEERISAQTRTLVIAMMGMVISLSSVALFQ